MTAYYDKLVTEEDIARLLLAAHDSREQALVEVTGRCGLGLKETAQLTPKGVLFDRGWIRAWGIRERLVPMPESTANALKDLRPMSAAGNYFWRIGVIQQRLKALGVRAGIEGPLQVPRLRASLVRRLFDSGTDPRVIQAVLGFSREPPRPLFDSIVIPWPIGKGKVHGSVQRSSSVPN